MVNVPKAIVEDWTLLEADGLAEELALIVFCEVESSVETGSWTSELVIRFAADVAVIDSREELVDSGAVDEETLKVDNEASGAGELVKDGIASMVVAEEAGSAAVEREKSLAVDSTGADNTVLSSSHAA